VGGRAVEKLKVVGTLVVPNRYPPVFSIFFDSAEEKGNVEAICQLIFHLCSSDLAIRKKLLQLAQRLWDVGFVLKKTYLQLC